MAFRYQAFGLTIQASRPISRLYPSEDPNRPVDVLLDFEKGTPAPGAHLSPLLWYESPRDPDGHRLRVWRLGEGSAFLFGYSDGVRFLIDGSGKQVSASWPDGSTFEDMATYLLGPVLGFILRLHGVVCLHASAVAFHHRALAFLSPSGFGKSSAAAVFAQRGFPVLSDDIVAISDQGDRFQVKPAYPRLQLWPTSVKTLFGRDDALPRITPQNPLWDKCDLDLNRGGYRFQTSPLELAAVYTGRHAEEGNLPRMEDLSAQAGFLALIANTYSSNLLDKEMRSLEFDVLSRLAAVVPVKCLKSQKNLIDLNRTCDMVLDDALGYPASIDSPGYKRS